MKNRLLLKTLCCLMAVICLLPGCEQKSPLLAHADDVGELKTDYAAIDLGGTTGIQGYTIENEEGETLSLVKKTNFHPYRPQGTMKYLNEADAGDGAWRAFRVPFSKTYAVSVLRRGTSHWIKKEVPEDEVMELKDRIQSRVTYYSEGDTIEQLTEGYYAMEQTDEDYWQKIVHHCNNVVELHGDLSELWVCFNITEGTKFGEPEVGRQKVEGQNTYTVHGSGKGHVIIALVDGEIRTEGMVGNYTVTRRLEDEDSDARLEYDETGKLIHTETGYYREDFHDFRPPDLGIG